MKRLLRISFDLSLLSFIPIISWFLLGIIVDKNLINIFTLTYPLQFIYYIIKSIFSTGANISKEKDKNKQVELYKKAEKILADETVIIPIISGSTNMYYQDYVKNININQFSTAGFKDTYLEKK